MKFDGNFTAERIEALIHHINQFMESPGMKPGVMKLVQSLLGIVGQLRNRFGGRTLDSAALIQLDNFAFTWEGVEVPTSAAGKSEAIARSKERESLAKGTTGRTVVIYVRCTEAERSTIQADYEAHGRGSLNAYVLSSLLRMAREHRQEVTP